jgi:hypothetical protein
MKALIKISYIIPFKSSFLYMYRRKCNGNGHCCQGGEGTIHRIAQNEASPTSQTETEETPTDL